MKFESIAENARSEIFERSCAEENLLSFGVQFLDDAMLGIMPNDLILIGSGSGGGKTQFCCNLALENVRRGKTVHYIALEADPLEIDRRIKFQIVAKKYFEDPNRRHFKHGLHYPRWILGMYGNDLEKYEIAAILEIEGEMQKLLLGYKADKFNVQSLIESVILGAAKSDLIIVDHVHYFDFDESDNETKSIREIAKIARTLALEQGKPIVLVAHLRKKDRFNSELVPSIEEFHGSSDLYKIATKAITFSSGSVTEHGNFETFFRIGKNRLDGSVTRYLGRTIFSPQRGAYEKKYQVGWAHQERRKPTPEDPNIFDELEINLWPHWVDRQTILGIGSHAPLSTLPNMADRTQGGARPYADN